MAKTAQLEAVLKDGVSGAAAKIGTALKGTAKTAEALNRTMKAGLSTRFTQQLSRFGLAGGDIDKVTVAFEKYRRTAGLAARASDWTKADRAKIRAWETATIASLRTVQAERARRGRMAVATRQAAMPEPSGAAGGMMLATRGLLPGLGLLGTAGLAKRAVVNSADFERRMTRVGMTADATTEQVSNASRAVRRIAQDTALPLDGIISGIESLVAQGKDLPTAMAMIGAIGKTAQASGADVDDIATTAGAVADSLKITAAELQNAFDIMVEGGKAGKFELKDMSRYLPSILPAASAVGQTGEEGLRRVVAMMQIVRNMTGSSEEAAASVQNIFAKMETDETSKRFKKFGVDLRGSMAKARKEGKDLLEVFIDLTDKALKGDLSKIPQLFGDMEFARGMRAIMAQRDELRRLNDDLRNASGSVARDGAKVINDSAASIQRLSNSWDGFLNNLGRTVAPGIVPVLDGLSAKMDEIESRSTTFQKLVSWYDAYVEERAKAERGTKPDGTPKPPTPFGLDLSPGGAIETWLKDRIGFGSGGKLLGEDADEAAAKGRHAAVIAQLEKEESVLARVADLRTRIAKAEGMRLPPDHLDSLKRELTAVEKQALEIRSRRYEKLRINERAPVQPVTPALTTFGNPDLQFKSEPAPEAPPAPMPAKARLPPVRPPDLKITPIVLAPPIDPYELLNLPRDGRIAVTIDPTVTPPGDVPEPVAAPQTTPTPQPIPTAAPTVDTTALDEAKAKAEEAGNDIKASLDVVAKPQVDVSSFADAESFVDRLLRKINMIGPASRQAQAEMGRTVGGAMRPVSSNSDPLFDR